MKIGIIIDKPRAKFLEGQEGIKEDYQKVKTSQELKRVIEKNYDCIEIVFSENVVQKIKKEKVDLVFNLCNGVKGDTSIAQLPAFLEYAGIPYTGSSITGHTIAYNKTSACSLFKSLGIPTPDFYNIFEINEVDKLDIDFPVILKPNDEGSSRGIYQDSLIYDRDSLKIKVAEALKKYNPPIMISEYIEGQEFSVGILGNGSDITVLPIAEVSFENLPPHLNKFYSFEVKTQYYDKVDLTCPTRTDEKLRQEIEKTAIKAYKALMIRDYARVDFRLKDGVPHVLEINSLPGLMKGYSLLTVMAESTNLGYEGLVYKIIESALKRYGMFDKNYGISVAQN